MLSQLKQEVAPFLIQELGGVESDYLSRLERPKNFDHGHLAFPCFIHSKSKGMSPQQLATDLELKLAQKIPHIKSVQAVAGFLNFTFRDDFLQKVLEEALKHPEKMGFQVTPKNEKVIIDFASPNVAKPMHVGHFRATLIGQSILHLARSQGYEVVGVNHLGDWGTQFGKLIWALMEWAPQFDWESPGVIDRLLALYVRFHDEAKKSPELEEQGALVFKKLENGDPQVRALWKKVIDASLVEYQRLFSLLNVKHDEILGEAFYSDKLEDVIQRLKSKSLLKESEGAQVVFFDEKEKMPPCLIQKSDGASIYATRDLAAAIYRREQMKGDHLLYVVGHDQSLHFKQVFRVLDLMGYSWSKNCHHIPFGLYRFKEGKISTREGRVITFEDLINKAIELAQGLIAEKNPDLPEKDKVAKQVAVAAVTFGDLMNDRSKDVEFDWDRMLSFEGDSGPFVQYTAVRCRGILKKSGKTVPSGFNPQVTLEPQETKLIYRILLLEDVLKIAYQQFKPNLLAQYLLDLCSDFSEFYRDCRVLGGDPEVEANRLLLVQAGFLALKQGLAILNIETPEAM